MRLISDLDHLEIILLESHSQGNVSHVMFKCLLPKIKIIAHKIQYFSFSAKQCISISQWWNTQTPCFTH